VAESAVDAAQSAQAGNSLEKVLCYQMAASHRAAMKLLDGSLNSSLPPVEMARLSNASACMMQISQEAVLTLQKLRTGGKQTVVVQHVQASEGGLVRLSDKPYRNRRIRGLFMNANAKRRRSRFAGTGSIKMPAMAIVPVAIAPFSSGPPRKSA
jgi:hypothetical protein